MASNISPDAGEIILYEESKSEKYSDKIIKYRNDFIKSLMGYLFIFVTSTIIIFGYYQQEYLFLVIVMILALCIGLFLWIYTDYEDYKESLTPFIISNLAIYVPEGRNKWMKIYYTDINKIIWNPPDKFSIIILNRKNPEKVIFMVEKGIGDEIKNQLQKYVVIEENK